MMESASAITEKEASPQRRGGEAERLTDVPYLDERRAVGARVGITPDLSLKDSREEDQCRRTGKFCPPPCGRNLADLLAEAPRLRRSSA